jgi:acetoacetyl-CoA reductase/3-oxoacyl-[acyl-carrier protein] reductase
MTMANDLVVLVTGSSRGIGAALAAGFARAGHRVVVNHAHSADEAEACAAALAAEVGDRVMCLRADVAERQAVRAMFEAAVTRFGRVDVLVNNAGLNLDGPFLTMTDEQWARVLATNLTGVFVCSQEFARRFAGEVGHILTVSASTAIQGRRNGANYCSAKAGVLALTKCLALELAPKIRVNCLAPGRIDTAEVMERLNLHDPATREAAIRATPAGRLGTPADVVRVARFLVEESDYITGQTFFVNGGALPG